MTASAGPAPRRRRLWLALVAALAVPVALIVAGNAYVIGTTRAWVLADTAAAPNRPVAIVLGNKVWPDGTPTTALADRLQVALALYQRGRAGRVIVSGRAKEGYDEPGAMAQWLVSRGIPAARITLDRGGHRTAATMADAAADGVRQALICTQPYHLARSLYLARRAGIDALGVPAHEGRDTPYGEVRNFIREALARAETVIEVALRGVRAN